MNWARTSWLRQGAYGDDSLLSFDCYIPKEIFEIVKSSFEGYIQKNEKKTAVYNLSIITSLIENGHQIELDGVKLNNENYTNRQIHLIQLCETSTNEAISSLAKLYKAEINHKDFKKEVYKTVDEIFGNKYFLELSKGVKVPEDIKFDNFRVGDEEYSIDFNYGVEHRIKWEEVSHEDFQGRDVYRVIPDKAKLPELKTFLIESQNYAKAPSANEDRKWMQGYDAATYEPKKKNGYKP